MYNLRYHVASLAAVFLALAVGLVLGTVVAERGMLTDQSGALVESLQQRFDEISATNDELRTGLERDRAFAEDLEPAVVGDALAGLDVAVIVGTGRVDGLNAVKSTVSDAGGACSVVSLESPGLGLASNAPEGLVGHFLARGEEMADPGKALEKQVADALVAEWTAAGPRPLTALLVSSGLIGLDSMSDTATVDAVVIMAGGDDGADAMAIAIGRAMVDAGGRVIGAETDSGAAGVAEAAAAAGFSAVDHLDTVQGRFSLAWLLAGRAEGVFGAGDGAEGFYPAFGPAD